MTKVAILGASGFVGDSVYSLLVNNDAYRVYTIDGDLLDKYKMRMTFEGLDPDYIINCAALTGSIRLVSERPANILDVNARMVLNLYDAARFTKATIINPVANCVYPGNLDRYAERDLFNGAPHESVAGYAITRRLMLTAAACYQREYGIKTVNLIAPNMYGPGDSDDPYKTHALNALIIKFVNAVINDLPHVEVWGTGKPVREWLFVRDFARIVKITIDSGASLAHNPVNIAQARGYSIMELAERIKRMTFYRGDIFYNDTYQDGAPSKIMDDDLFLETFPGFEFTRINDGIQETIDYYEARHG